MYYFGEDKYCNRDKISLNYTALQHMLDVTGTTKKKAAKELGYDYPKLCEKLKANSTIYNQPLGHNMLNLFGPIATEELSKYLYSAAMYNELEERNIFQFLYVIVKENEIPEYARRALYVALYAYIDSEGIRVNKTTLRIKDAVDTFQYDCFKAVCVHYFKSLSFTQLNEYNIEDENGKSLYSRTWDEYVKNSTLSNDNILEATVRFNKIMATDILSELTKETVRDSLRNIIDRYNNKNETDITFSDADITSVLNENIEKSIEGKYKDIVYDKTIGNYDFFFQYPKNNVLFSTIEEVNMKEIYLRCMFGYIAQKKLKKRELNYLVDVLEKEWDYSLDNDDILELYDNELRQYDNSLNTKKFKIEQIRKLANHLGCTYSYLAGASLWPHIGYVVRYDMTGLDHLITPITYERFDAKLNARDNFYHNNYKFIEDIENIFDDLNINEKKRMLRHMKKEKSAIFEQREKDRIRPDDILMLDVRDIVEMFDSLSLEEGKKLYKTMSNAYKKLLEDRKNIT